MWLSVCPKPKDTKLGHYTYHYIIYKVFCWNNPQFEKIISFLIYLYYLEMLIGTCDNCT